MLIDALADQLTPVERSSAVQAALLKAGLIGAVAAFALACALFGAQPMLAVAAGPLLVKTMYSLAFAAVATVASVRLSRPGSKAGAVVGWLGAPVLALAVAASVELAQAPESARLTMALGHSVGRCLRSVPLIAIPAFLLLCRAARRQAPTRLRSAGAAAGGLAGAVAAAVYALFCGENAASFVLIWYSAAIALCAAAGAALGPRLLRW